MLIQPRIHKKNRISIAFVISWLSIRSFVESNRY